jgi:uncharacterized protein YjbJ (UPF0337 family)
MGLTDKLTGRIKQAAGDLTGSESLKGEGHREERKGEAKDELAHQEARAEREEARAERKAAEVDRLDRTT